MGSEHFSWVTCSEAVVRYATLQAVKPLRCVKHYFKKKWMWVMEWHILLTIINKWMFMITPENDYITMFKKWFTVCIPIMGIYSLKPTMNGKFFETWTDMLIIVCSTTAKYNFISKGKNTPTVCAVLVQY